MISVLDSALFGDLFCVDDRIAAVFADRQRLADLLAVEVALARAEATVGVIPTAAADAIAAAAGALAIDTDAIRRGVAASGVPTIELVRQLRRAMGADHAGFVHRGATSQDIVDTAAILAIRRATALIEERLKEAIDALIALADRHKNTVMAGRTHGQQASPITFGLKAANWLAPLPRHRQRLAELKPRLLVVQFGGAAGTLAALDDRGPKVQEALARELDLGPAVPWHTQRDAIVEYGGWLALVAGSLGKMGQDLTLMAQTEVGEILESSDGVRGGSSTMPHKANPIGSEMMVVAAQATAALLSALHAAALQEHERSTHGWPLEWLVVPQMIALTYGGASHATVVARELTVNVARMRDNLRLDGGAALAESLALALAVTMPLEDAQALVRHAAIDRRGSSDSLVAAVRRAAASRGFEPAIDWDRLSDPSAYLGAAGEIVDRILEDAKQSVR
jgi:3-carboxy-cis,cis-muconate cycloisomerase